MSDEDNKDDTETYSDEDEEQLPKSRKGSKRRRRFSIGTKMKFCKVRDKLNDKRGDVAAKSRSPIQRHTQASY